MANSYTSLLQLAKPAAGDVDWDDEVNGNSEKLDALLWQKYLPPTRDVQAVVLGAGAVGPHLAASTQYFYRVTALNALGETNTAVEASATEGVTPRPIQVNWEAVSGATGYKVYKGTVSGTLFLLATVGIVTTYQDDGNTAVGVTPFPTANTALLRTDAYAVLGIAASPTPAPSVLVPLDAMGRYQAADGSLITNLNVPEVITARGSMPSLDARLDVTLNEDGTFKLGAAFPDDAVTSQKLAEWDGLTTAAQPNTGSGVATAHLKGRAVETNKIADADGTSPLDSTTGKGIAIPQLRDDVVVSQKLADADGTTGQNTGAGAGVKTGHIQDNAITTSKIASGAITADKLAGVLLASTPIWTKYTVPYSAFTAAATEESLVLAALPAGSLIHAAKVKHSTAFAGGTLTGFTVEVGIAGDTTKYASAFDVFQPVGNTTFYTAQMLFSEDHGSPFNVLVTGRSAGDDVDQATIGDVEIWLLVSQAV